jgi:Holliday junction resolvase-like predicted endonuclease
MMETQRKSVGSTGEETACGYLVNNGYKILERNYRTKFGEIDIVAKSPDKTLVFVEVKTMRGENRYMAESPENYPQESGNGVEKLGKVRQEYTQKDDGIIPEDQMSASKIKKFRRIAEWYANNYTDLKKSGFRLDLVSVVLRNCNSQIKHYKNI